jgi:hypothetical protein
MVFTLISTSQERFSTISSALRFVYPSDAGAAVARGAIVSLVLADPDDTT